MKKNNLPVENPESISPICPEEDSPDMTFRLFGMSEEELGESLDATMEGDRMTWDEFVMRLKENGVISDETPFLHEFM